MFTTRSAAQVFNRRLPCLIQSVCVLWLSSGILAACSGGPSTPPGTNKQVGSGESSKGTNTARKSGDAIGSEDDLNEMDDTSAEGKHKKAKATKPALSTEGKKTGVMEDTVIVQQQNEFLGASTLKLSKSGIRLESSTVTVVMPPGQEAIAYNAQNGNCMVLSSNNRSILGGGGKPSDEGKQTSIKVGTEKLAGLNCIHSNSAKSCWILKQKNKPAPGTRISGPPKI